MSGYYLFIIGLLLGAMIAFPLGWVAREMVVRNILRSIDEGGQQEPRERQ